MTVCVCPRTAATALYGPWSYLVSFPDTLGPEGVWPARLSPTTQPAYSPGQSPDLGLSLHLSHACTPVIKCGQLFHQTHAYSQACERDYKKQLEENRLTDNAKFTYAWHLIKSQYKNDIRKGIKLMGGV